MMFSILFSIFTAGITQQILPANIFNLRLGGDADSNMGQILFVLRKQWYYQLSYGFKADLKVAKNI
jgi:hypothetical protein